VTTHHSPPWRLPIASAGRPESSSVPAGVAWRPMLATGLGLVPIVTLLIATSWEYFRLGTFLTELVILAGPVVWVTPFWVASHRGVESKGWWNVLWTGLAVEVVSVALTIFFSIQLDNADPDDPDVLGIGILLIGSAFLVFAVGALVVTLAGIGMAVVVHRRSRRPADPA
jgi:hypothetical protein